MGTREELDKLIAEIDRLQYDCETRLSDIDGMPPEEIASIARDLRERTFRARLRFNWILATGGNEQT